MSTQTIRNGASILINLQPGETLKVVAVTGNYTITGSAGSVAGTTIATAATGGTYGPYPAAVTLQLTSSALSEIDFDSGAAPVIESDAPAMVITNPLTGGVALSGPNGKTRSFGNFMPAMTAAVIGNSIVTAQKYGGFGTAWGTKSEIHIANALAGSPLVFPRITASTRADQYAVYGYSGQTLPTINADLPAQLWTPLATAVVSPAIVIGLALLENDIGQGLSVADMQAALTQFVRDAQARFPGAILMLATPRPSFSYDTAAKVAAYQAMRDYTLALDNGVNVFVARLDTYENPASRATPLGTSGAPIFTDSSVHPNGRGAFRNARVLAATLRRIASSFKQAYGCVGTNLAMIGTGTASGTNVSGTVPTSVAVSGSANGVYVATAERPGLLQTITANASGAEPPVDLSNSNVGAVAISGGANTQLSPFIELEIVSGAENLAWLQVRPRFAGAGGGNIVADFVKRNTNDIDPDYQNGDVLLFRVPSQMAGDITGVTGNFSGCQIYWQAWPKITGGAFSFRVKSAGVGIVVP